MATKNIQITQLQSDNSLDILHPETDASIVKVTSKGDLKSTNVQSALEEINEKAQKSGVTGVKGEKESSYRKGDVNITLANIGAEPAGSVSSHNTSSAAHQDIRNSVSTAQSKANSAYTLADEAKRLAEGRAKAVSFDTEGQMISSLKNASKNDYKVGDNLFIKAVGVPDYWISKILDNNSGTYGYFEISKLETQKVDLSLYQLKTDNGLETSSKSIVTAINEVNKQANDTANLLYNTHYEEQMQTVDRNEEEIRDLSVDLVNIKTGVTAVPKATKAATATKLETARTIALTNDIVGSTTFDGSANASITATLKNVGTAGTYSVVTTDVKGRVTSGGSIIEVGTVGQASPSSKLAIGGIFYKVI